eukprot:6471411-Amphidinium_carterae.1
MKAGTTMPKNPLLFGIKSKEATHLLHTPGLRWSQDAYDLNAGAASSSSEANSCYPQPFKRTVIWSPSQQAGPNTWCVTIHEEVRSGTSPMSTNYRISETPSTSNSTRAKIKNAKNVSSRQN